MNIRANILMRVYLAFGLIVLFALAVVVQLCRVQFVQGKKWSAMADSLSTKYVTVDASRGNILAVDGSLLATSVPEYELHMDMLAAGIESQANFDLRIDSLAGKLSSFFGDHSTREYSRMLRNARADSARYQLIRRKVTYQQLKAIRKFPVFNLGKYKGGLIVIAKNKRIMPFQSLAARTIGYKNENVDNPVGLEGAYADYINGENGKRLMQRIAGGVWTPVNEDDEVATVDGADIVSTLDVNFQDVAQKALRHQLDSIQADFGTVVLMETATGEIRAIANLTRDPKDNKYYEKQNYAISYAAEPGSTFKLASYMALLDDNKIDTGKQVDVMHGGPYQIINPRNGRVALRVRDAADEGGVISARRAFELSSNIGAVKLVLGGYANNPKAFTDKLYSWHLQEKNRLQIRGEGQPVIKNPGSKHWNKLQSLAQIAYGYESKLTPLQMLTFYNSVANNGKMVAPVFVREIRRLGNTVERFPARVINPQVCSPEALVKVKSLLEGVVQEGTGKTHIKNKLYTVAGKTGTAQIANGSLGYGSKSAHQASFCGYFPANDPKYSMIVVISNPRKGLHLAAWVAGPVFRKIADRVYAQDIAIKRTEAPMNLVGNTHPPKIKEGDNKAVKQVYSKLGMKPMYASNEPVSVDTSAGLPFEASKFKKGTVPSVTGMGLSDAMYALSNAGYKINARGSGVVASQSVTTGSAMPKGSTITIVLE
ncbi:penicillin-binding protein [Mucilaginibacter myungsuensis]|uniref:Transpeptidase family protein n=1 Tax=Mucilaginibacter myungsuensis TaxID=649104 RepID=A0A929PW57_9SPHI|nr:penicillin-binding protein [Mucilaginibacter myungsuensis]MBE9661731.1 transpeptidase family protein [Mucilaginibacter myungsuensis]MDN3599837.1 penicillin-binding protein [Mucilaginibacter myungsuensis]